ncbi:hypothetical protein WJX81_007834 [Elliptochloris bilobata]|uniref:Uncharacterized protein n=1 Tax=Elliptochloris bilobata TaxID=381761 RepID=A0AAW1QMQ5_9CHLO
MEAPQQQKVVKKSRSHLLRHELPNVDLLEAFGTTDGREIAKDIARWGQKELQAKFKVVYGTPTFSNNNNWLRRKLAEAAGLQTPKVVGTGVTTPRNKSGHASGVDLDDHDREPGGIRRTKRQRKPKHFVDMFIMTDQETSVLGSGSHQRLQDICAPSDRGLTSAARFHDSLGWVGSCGLLGGSPLRGAAARSAAFLVPEVVWPGAPHMGPSAPSLQFTHAHAALHPLMQARPVAVQGRSDESGSSSEDHTSFDQPATYEGECTAAARSPRARNWLPLGLDTFDLGAPGGHDRLLQQWEAHLFAPPAPAARAPCPLFPGAGRTGLAASAGSRACNPNPIPGRGGAHQDDPFLRELEARMPSLAAPGDDPLLSLGGAGRLPSLLGDPLLHPLPGVPEAPGYASGGVRPGGLDARAFLSDLRAAEAPDAAGPVDVGELLRELRAAELPFAAAAAQAGASPAARAAEDQALDAGGGIISESMFPLACGLHARGSL